MGPGALSFKSGQEAYKTPIMYLPPLKLAYLPRAQKVFPIKFLNTVASNAVIYNICTCALEFTTYKMP